MVSLKFQAHGMYQWSLRCVVKQHSPLRPCKVHHWYGSKLQHIMKFGLSIMNLKITPQKRPRCPKHEPQHAILKDIRLLTDMRSKWSRNDPYMKLTHLSYTPTLIGTCISVGWIVRRFGCINDTNESQEHTLYILSLLSHVALFSRPRFILIRCAKYGSQYHGPNKTSFQYLLEGCTNRHLSNVKHNPIL